MRRDRPAGRIAISGHDIDNSVREAGLLHEGGETERAQGGELARFHHDRVAGGQRRPQLPAREHQREVPRNDLSHNADGLAKKVVEETRFHRDHRALVLVGHSAEISIPRSRPRNIQPGRVANRMSGIDSLQPRQLGGVGLDEVRQPQQHPAAVGGGCRRPRRKRALRCVHRAVDVGGPCFGDTSDHRPVVRIEDIKLAASSSVDPPPVDEQAGLQFCRVETRSCRQLNVEPHAGLGQKSTGWLGSLPVAYSSGSSPSAFSQTRSIARFGA